MKKYIPILFLLLVTSSVSYTQETMPKHEIGFFVGVFPIIEIATGMLEPNHIGEEKMGQFYHIRKDSNFEKMYHLGSYTFSYNYHFNSKHSIGGSASWVGKHVDIYWVYPAWGFWGSGRPAITVEGSGWIHYFTLQGNYRRTYYRTDHISLFFGVNVGATLCLRSKEILPEEEITFLLGSISNARYIFGPAFHITAFGVETGTKHVFNMELGIGTQGSLKIGYKYRF
ncbi:MAG: hypothetical protein FWG79_03780 [Bacteroidales bacterium]|nr:hypothetical protein [Bacteroidales bacterium]